MNRQKAQKTIDTLRSASCETKEARLKKVMTAAGLKASGVCDHFDSSLNDFKGDQIRTKYLGSGLIDQSQKMTVAAMQMAEKKV